MFALAIQYERQVKSQIDQEVTDSAVLFVGRRNSNLSFNGRNMNFPASHAFLQKKFIIANTWKRPTCTFYGFPGHTVKKCYKKHGYPPGYRTRKFSGVVNQIKSKYVFNDNHVVVVVHDPKGK